MRDIAQWYISYIELKLCKVKAGVSSTLLEPLQPTLQRCCSSTVIYSVMIIMFLWRLRDQWKAIKWNCIVYFCSDESIVCSLQGIVTYWDDVFGRVDRFLAYLIRRVSLVQFIRHHCPIHFSQGICLCVVFVFSGAVWSGALQASSQHISWTHKFRVHTLRSRNGKSFH